MSKTYFSLFKILLHHLLFFFFFLKDPPPPEFSPLPLPAPLPIWAVPAARGRQVAVGPKLAPGFPNGEGCPRGIRVEPRATIEKHAPRLVRLPVVERRGFEPEAAPPHAERHDAEARVGDVLRVMTERFCGIRGGRRTVLVGRWAQRCLTDRRAIQRNGDVRQQLTFVRPRELHDPRRGVRMIGDCPAAAHERHLEQL